MNKGQLPPGVRVRVQAALVLLEVTRDYQQLDDAIQQHATGIGAADTGLMQAICFGVMRWYLTLMSWLEQLADRPVNQLKPEVRVVILIGLYQLKFMRIPAHAAIHATVESAGYLQAKRAKGLINAVLRGFQRLEKSSGQDQHQQAREEVRYAHPQWMLQEFQADWPDSWYQIVEYNNRQAPMALRVNLQRITREEYLAQLQQSAIDAHVHPVAESCIVLSSPVAVDMLPGFQDGLVSVQDAAAQLAAPLLRHTDRHRVLDACAAPGGKTTHILEIARPAYLAALDNSSERLARVHENVQRVGAVADIVQGDASSPHEWWDGEGFDRILLDAPCSASGVIRRHPDIKYLRSPKSIARIVRRQAKILDAMWQVLNSGGMLLYVTCSIFKAENEQQIIAFLERHEDARLEAMQASWGQGTTGRQLLPGDHDMDGFYFAPIRKQ
jgi:16S rRNA (cytosine967-C5)-methyltransferase